MNEGNEFDLDGIGGNEESLTEFLDEATDLVCRESNPTRRAKLQVGAQGPDRIVSRTHCGCLILRADFIRCFVEHGNVFICQLPVATPQKRVGIHFA